MSRQLEPGITSSPVGHFRLLLGPQRCTYFLLLTTTHSNASTDFLENSKHFFYLNFRVGPALRWQPNADFFFQRMKFIIIISVTLAAISLAAPADDTKATENTVLESANGYGQGGPAPSGCYWNGVPDFCIPFCDAPYFEVKEDACGDGECCLIGFKVLCCKY